jgi:hypothetical protein
MNHQVVWPLDLKCSDLFNDFAVLGSGAACLSVDAQTLRIFLGSNMSLDLAKQGALNVKQSAVQLNVKEFLHNSAVGMHTWPSAWIAPTNAAQLVLVNWPQRSHRRYGTLVAHIDAQMRVGEGETITLDGSRSSGAGGVAVRTYLWSVVSIGLDDVWEDYVSSFVLDQLRDQILSLYSQALEASRRAQIAFVHVNSSNLTSILFAATDATLRTLPSVRIVFRLDVGSLLDHPDFITSTNRSVLVLPFSKVPKIVARSPLMQVVPRSSNVTLQVSVEAQSGVLAAGFVPIPTSWANWMVRFPNGTTLPVNHYRQIDLGRILVPKMVMPLGMCEFSVVCSYFDFGHNLAGHHQVSGDILTGGACGSN